MKLLKLLTLTVLLNIGCGGIHYVPAPPTQPSYPLKPIAVITGLEGAGSAVTLLDTRGHGDITLKATSDATGYAGFPEVSATLDATHITVTLAGCQTYDQWVKLSEVAPHNQVFITLNCHFDPSTLTLRQIAAVRGAMWPQGLGLSKGPRPGAADNIIATDFYNNYSPDEQKRILAWEKQQGYTHVVVGPIVDSDGYHGIYTPNDWRGKFEEFLDILQTFYDNGQIPVIFIHPDGWTLEQTKELTPLFQSPRAQRLMRFIVPSGWEPAHYEWSSCTWAGYVSWARQTWPNAVVAIHTVTDVDAPVGTDALCDDNGQPNGKGWQRVADAGLHVWLVQNGAYESSPIADPTLAYNFGGQFSTGPDGAATHGAAWHFANGVADWPTNSGWGNEPIWMVNAEVTSYTAFWGHILELYRTQWGDLAIKSGARGYLDGGTVPVR